MILENIDFSTVLKCNKLTLKKDFQIKICEQIQDEINTQNVTTFFQLSEVFNLTDVSKSTFNYIDRWFTVVVESKNFLELEYTIVAKLLASSQLTIDSEVEVVRAANKWLSHNIEERCDFAKYLLLKIRLPLLSDHALKHTIIEPSSFSRNKDCIAVLEDVLNNKENFVRKSSNLLCTYRYCNQQNSNIFMCGGRSTRSTKVFRKGIQFDGNNFKNVKNISFMKKQRWRCKAIRLKEEIYVFGGIDEKKNVVMTIEKYSPLDNCWSIVTDMYDGRTEYCTCSFMGKIYIIGGYNNGSLLDSCIQFDPNCSSNNKWKTVAKMNQAKQDVACAIFEGKIVLSGGCNFLYTQYFNAVESYDVIGNEWLPMPKTIEGVNKHSLVVVKSRLFVIGSTGLCQVLDNTSNKFVALKSNLSLWCFHYDTVINIGDKIYVYPSMERDTTKVFCYDVQTNKWSEDSCEFTKDLVYYSIVNIPCEF